MNNTENTMLQDMIQWQRYWHRDRGYGWPGKTGNAPAVTRYPNLLAELGYGSPWLHLLAEFADVSQEIMAAALEDNEELNFGELWRLARYLRVPLEYLTAPGLSVVDPATNKGRVRRRALADMMIVWADELKYQRWEVENVLSSLNEGKAVTYASYRWAVGELQSAINRKQREQHKPRSCRRATA